MSIKSSLTMYLDNTGLIDDIDKVEIQINFNSLIENKHLIIQYFLTRIKLYFRFYSFWSLFFNDSWLFQQQQNAIWIWGIK